MNPPDVFEMFHKRGGGKDSRALGGQLGLSCEVFERAVQGTDQGSSMCLGVRLDALEKDTGE